MERSRREFLLNAGRLVVALPVGVSLLGAIGCGNQSGQADACSNAGRLTAAGAGLTFTSSCDFDHTHDFALMLTELSAPPAAGITRDTSEVEEDHHLHSVALTAAELAQIQSGMTVMKTSSSSLNHTHTYAFKKV